MSKVLDELEVELGREALDNMHIHVSGISSNSKGDLKHLDLEKSKFDWQACLRALREFNCKGYVICYSPSLESDAKKMKDYYMTLQ